MRACPCSLFLGLMIILYLQSCVEGNYVKGPEECCFSFFTSPIPVSVIRSYKETGAHCPIPGVVFTTPRGHVCVDPNFKWVKRAMGKIDRQNVDGFLVNYY